MLNVLALVSLSVSAVLHLNVFEFVKVEKRKLKFRDDIYFKDLMEKVKRQALKIH